MNSDTASPEKKPRRRRRWLWWFGMFFLVMFAWQVVAWLTPVPAPLATAVAATDKVYEFVYSDDIIHRASELPKEINILLVGLDNRVASDDNHADAIHLISVRTKDSIGVTITSIPRGTEVKGYGIDPDLSFMANVRALKGRKTFMNAVARLTKKKKIDYYVEVTFSQVMGVLELLGYDDPPTALQYLRHRKSYLLGDVQRSFNQGKFIRHQMIRRSDLLTGAKGAALFTAGVGMVDTDIDLETVQAIIYLLQESKALDEQHITQDMRPRINLARLDSSAAPEPEDIASVVNKLVRKTGDDIDDLGRYNPYPKIRGIVQNASAQKNPKSVIAILEPVYSQKAWLQVQERPQRRELRDSVEDLLVRAYTELKKPEKATEVHEYMVNERKLFSEVEREERRFAYGRRPGVSKSHARPVDAAVARRARQDDIRQKQTRVDPQPRLTPTKVISTPPSRTVNDAQSHQKPIPVRPPKSDEPQVIDISKPEGGG